jgi:hypothetical protein
MPLDFNENAADGETDFESYANAWFGRETTREIMGVLKKLGIAAPAYDDEYLNGTEGPLVLLNRYGLVLRIEDKESEIGGKRIDGSAWAVPALVSIPAGQAVIELTPGGWPDENVETHRFLRTALDLEAVYLWDMKYSNFVRQTVKTEHFPEGAPGVSDRLAMTRMSSTLAEPNPDIQAMAAEVLEAREKLFAPLKQAFAEGWDDPAKMPAFWKMAEEYVRDGKLVAGWNDPALTQGKTQDAAKTAARYEERAKLVEEGVEFCPTVHRRLYLRGKPDRGAILI